MEVQNILNADPEGFIPEDRFNACKDALKRHREDAHMEPNLNKEETFDHLRQCGFSEDEIKNCFERLLPNVIIEEDGDESWVVFLN